MERTNKSIIKKRESGSQSIESTSKFDLEYILKIGEEYTVNKNGKIRNIYETDYEEVSLATEQTQQDEDEFAVDQQFIVEQVVEQAIMQYHSGIVIPQKPPKKQAAPPSIKVKLDFVNGFNCLESTQNVRYVVPDKTKPTKVLFSAATLGVVMDTSTYVQEYYGVTGSMQSKVNENPNKIYEKHHKFYIVSLAYDKELDLVATGSMGSNPEICIWKASSMTPVAKMYQGKGTKAVSLLSFMRDKEGVFLLSVDRKSKSTSHLNLWSTEGKKLLQGGKKIPGSIYAMASSQQYVGLATDKRGVTLVSGKDRELTEHKVEKGFMTSVCFVNGRTLFGSSVGELVYQNKTYQVHKGAIFCVHYSDSRVYSSGGDDKTLKIHNETLTLLIAQIQLEEYARSIDVLDKNILLSIRSGKIIELYLEENKLSQKQVLMNSHCSGSLWGLSYDKSNDTFVTAGDDNKILAVQTRAINKKKKVIWEDVISNKVEYNKKYDINKLNFFSCSKQVRALEVNRCLIAYVTGVGDLVVRHYPGCGKQKKNSEDPQHIQKVKDKSECIRFSRDGKYLAVGSHDECIYLFEVLQKPDTRIHDFIKPKGVLSGHFSYVTSIDFSEDNKYLRSTGGHGELRYWDLESMKEIIMNSKNTPPSQKQMIKKASWQSIGKFCYQTNQIWKETKDIDFINRVCVSPNGKYIVAGEDDNCVRIYNNPCTAGVFRRLRGHAHHVQNICWSHDNKYLASVGGIDRCLMIWQISQN